MELLKAIKPYLEEHYAVVSDRADLYAYFFELGVRRLKPGGRLGYISSSTFFRTGSGAPLRDWLAQAADLEAVIDFGDVQLFEGVTTYPAILTMRKRDNQDETALGTDLRFLNLTALPTDLAKAFEEGAETMPQTRLARGGWRFEGDALAELGRGLWRDGKRWRRLMAPRSTVPRLSSTRRLSSRAGDKSR